MPLPVSTTAAGLTLAVFLSSPAAVPDVAQYFLPPESLHRDVRGVTNSHTGNVARVLPTGLRWGTISGMIARSVSSANQDGEFVGLAAAQLAYGVAAAIDAPGAPVPAVSDNEMGGLVLYWKGFAREIQIEIDADSSHFVRIKGASGRVEFSHEGFGDIPTEEINRSLREWADERARRLPVNTSSHS